MTDLRVAEPPFGEGIFELFGKSKSRVVHVTLFPPKVTDNMDRWYFFANMR